jgi:hypothetical protein
MLKGLKKAAPFRALRLPDPINWLEPELMTGKAFEEAELRANAAGTCSLSALMCMETSRAYANIIHTMCKTLLPMANASQEELTALKAWRDNIRHEVAVWVDHIKTRFDMGAKLSAALFNKETEIIRQQMAKAPELAPAHTILLNSCFSQTRLFTDDARITKAMEAADKHRPFTPKSSYSSGQGYKPRGVGAVTSTYAHQARKPTQHRKPKAAKSPAKKSGKPQRPSASQQEARRPFSPR